MMIAEALDKADNYFKISEARNEPGKLLMLSDCIYHQIMRAQDEEDRDLMAAKGILERINNRKLYQFCGQTSPLPTDEEASLAQSGRTLSIDHDGALSPGVAERRRQEKLCKKVTDGIISYPKFSVDITDQDLLVEVIVLRYGNGYNDPLDNIDFVNKEGKLVTRSPSAKDRAGPTFMKAFQEEYVRVYARRKEKIREINNRFYQWCERNQYDVPKDMEKTPIENDERDTVAAVGSARRRIDFGGSEDVDEAEDVGEATNRPEPAESNELSD